MVKNPLIGLISRDDQHSLANKISTKNFFLLQKISEENLICKLKILLLVKNLIQ